MTTQQPESATPAPEVSPEESDALLQDVDFGDAETPPPRDQSASQEGQDGGGDVGTGEGGEGANQDGEGAGEPITLTQAELDSRIEEVRRETQSARDREFDTLRNEVNQLKQGSEQSALDLAETQAVEDVAQVIMRDNPSVTSSEARAHAQREVRAERQRFETGRQLNDRATTLEQREAELTQKSLSLAAREMQTEYGLTAQQVENVLKLPDADSMKLVAGLYKQTNEAAATNDKNNQERVEGQNFGLGGATDDIIPTPSDSGDAELDRLMNLDTRDGTLTEADSARMEAEGWTP